MSVLDPPSVALMESSVSGGVAKTRLTAEEEEEVIKELCSSNGLSYGRLQQEGHTISSLEMFFSGYPKLVGLQHFPNLTSLKVIGQLIERVEGLSSLTKLQELWICECQIKKVEHLEGCKDLKKLFMYGNEISFIENLDHLCQLEVLWLNTNLIENIENLGALKKLRDLNLAENQIDKIGHNLLLNQNLENLNLSGNKLYAFKDLTHLIKLPKLKCLSLKDSQYPSCPVSLLCNYSTHILFHLPSLQQLDTYDVSNQTLHDLAGSTVSKKKMYYNMRVKMVKRNMSDIATKMKSLRDQLLQFPYDRLKALIHAVKQIEREVQENCVTVEEVDGYNSGTESDKDAKENQVENDKAQVGALESKQLALVERSKKWEKKAQSIESYYQDTLTRIKHARDIQVGRMVTELESGGNIRFEDGVPSNVWFTSCHDLILSRFCATDYKEYGITGIRVHRITRVHNRILRSRFEDKVGQMTDETDGEFYPGTNTEYKKLLEYLFWVWNPDLAGGNQEPVRVLEEGFLDADTAKKLGGEAAVPLTNSLSLADRHRMRSLAKHAKDSESSDPCPFRYGRLVIAKVYLGKSTQTTEYKEISQASYPKMDAVYKPRKKCFQSYGNNSQTGKSTCECNNRQCEWYIFDHELAVPEYVIEFEYVTRSKPKSPFSSVTDWLTTNGQVHRQATHIEESPDIDDDVLDMEPKLKPRPRLISLSEELLLKTLKLDSIAKITVLNLHGNGITKLKYLQNMPQLKKLILSFNEIGRVDELAHMGIEYLDVSFNKVYTLEGIRGMTKLKYLDLSWNRLHNTREELSILRKHMPCLQTLDLRQNDWQKLDGLRLRTIGRLKTLTCLNGIPVTEEEATAALRVAAGARISQVSLLTMSRTDCQAPRSLSLLSTAQCLTAISRSKPEKLTDLDNSWYSKVTSLNLDGQHITKLSNLDRLENLRWASFNDNDLTKIEGLESCSHLEDLSLENNCIAKIENISKLQKLQRVNLSHNYISTLENTGLQNLPQLQYLSVDNNKLPSLAGLQRASLLVELYAGNNQITNIREIFYLKGLADFVILDLWGNTVAKSVDNYRLFVIYHLKSLKALDGAAIEASEGHQAKDTFGGRLSLDFIAERLSHANFQDIRELDFPSCSIRTVDLGTGEQFYNLRSVNLEHNNLTSFSGLRNLVNLRVLCLNHNHVECIVPQSKAPKTKGSSHALASDPSSPESFTPLLENLEVLHLGYNGIKDMAALQLGRLTSLKALFLQGNEIMRIEGLDGLHDLRELVLDKNKIKTISDTSFVNQWNLQELHLEENRIRDLPNLSSLENLQRLYLGSNRIQDIGELEKLECLTNLVELSVVNNAIARRLMHRPMIVFRMPTLIVIDGIPVSDDERAKAELYFMEQQYQPPSQPVSDTTLPGISQYKSQIPVKVTNMHLGSSPSWGGPVYYDDGFTDQTQRVGRKRAGARNGDTGSGNRSTTLTYQYSTPSTNQYTSLYTNGGVVRSHHSYHNGQGPSSSTQNNNTEYIDTRYSGRSNNKR